MARWNDDPETFPKYAFALSEWNVEGYVDFNKRPQDWIRTELGKDPRWFAEKMHQHVSKGGKVSRVKEMGNPEDYPNEFHDDMIIEILGRKVYVETIFDEHRDKESCRIVVVSVKWNKK